jgi:Uncharacterised nucleotidyltransferase
LYVGRECSPAPLQSWLKTKVTSNPELEHRPSHWFCRCAEVMVLSSMAAIAELRPDLAEALDLPERVSAADAEFDLLVACCAGREQNDRIRKLLGRPLDWERLFRLVEHHRVIPQVFGELSVFSHLIPAQAFHVLHSRYDDNARKALWFSAELVRIASHLESAGIRALPYKGPVLAQALYGEVTERQFGDLDFLILPADVPKAKAALLDLRYEPAIALLPEQERAFIAAGYEIPFRAVSGTNMVEVQWRVLPRFYSIDFNVADFLERAGKVNLGGYSLRTLRAEDLLLVLCVHAAKHVWVQLSWLCDIAQLAKTSQLDWNAIHGEATRLGIERIVTVNLLLAHRLLGMAMPPAMESVVCSDHSSIHSRSNQIAGRVFPVEDPTTDGLVDEIRRIIEGSAHYDTESFTYFRLMMHLRERRQDQVRFLWRLAVTPGVNEWSAVQLPQALHPIYRVVRLLRLAKRLASGRCLTPESRHAQ